MKSNIFTIMQKEFTRFFKDKRMVFTTIIMPGLLIYVMYTFVGQSMGSIFAPDAGYTPQVYVENLPEAFVQMEPNLQLQFISTTDTDGIKKNIESAQPGYDLLVIFPEDFSESIANYTIGSGQTATPNIRIYFNSTLPDSTSAYSTLVAVLDAYKSSIVNLFDVNAGDGPYDLASARDQTGQIISMMVPLLMMIFLFSGCIAVAPEAIAGEKERGTIATLLVTPMRRRDLALGKIMSLSVIAVLSGLSSFLGTMLSMPNLMGGSGMDLGVYDLMDYLLLLALILSTVLVMVALISVISAFAKTIKEASTWVMPLNIAMIFIGLSTMIPGLQAHTGWMYLIPFYNSVQSMNGIFSFDYQSVDIGITVVANLFYTGVCVVTLTRMFGNERVMFAK